ncbi:MAG: tyrosine-type recombinase/integrase [Candidatus Peribacteraceae bacterium]
MPHSYHRRAPYIYSDDDIERLLAAAGTLSSSHGLRGRTYATLFGLLTVTGLRISEALGLDREDIDLRTGVLTIRHAKFGKTRYVPIHRTTCDALGRYARNRDRIFPTLKIPAWFVSEQCVRITKGTAERTFHLLVRKIGLRGLSDRPGPRLHDFRHSFAVRTLLSWYRAGLDVERKMAHLSTYLGHVEIRDTYWYISATPELLYWAARRVDTPKTGGGE